MITKFDVGDQVFITAVVDEITVDKDGIFYEVRCRHCNGVYTLVLSEDKLQLKKKSIVQKDEKKTD